MCCSKKVKLFAILLLFAVIPTVQVITAPLAQTVSARDLCGEILYAVYNDSGDGDIWMMNADGSDQRVILDTPNWDVDPDWSADGTMIAFVSNRSMSSFDIYTMNADGSNISLLADKRFHDNLPRWSPVSNEVLFHAKVNNGMPGVFIAGAGGIQTVIDTGNFEGYADWSPDGSQIVFSGTADGDSDLYVINPDGSGLIQMTNMGGVTAPRWSPDGTKAAFQAPGENGSTEIFVIYSDGTLQQVTHDPAIDSNPTWSPDSAYIAFRSDRNGNRDIFVADLLGSEPLQLTNSPLHEQPGDWRGRCAPSGAANTTVDLTVNDADLTPVINSLPGPVDPDRILFIDGAGDGLPIGATYQFEMVEVAPGIVLETSAIFSISPMGIQPMLEWRMQNTGNTPQRFEYIVDLPKSFAQSASQVQFDPPPTEILNDDPLLKWLVDVDKTSHVLIRAQSAQMVALGAAVQGGDAQSLTALKDNVSNLLIDIDMRRQLALCRMAATSDDNENYAALCSLFVMGNYPGNFFPSDCDMAFDQVGGSNLGPAFRTACHAMMEQTSDHGRTCDALGDPALQRACKTSIRYVLTAQCALLSGNDLERCKYDAAVQSHDSEGCDRLNNVDLSAACNAYIDQDPNYCMLIVNETAMEACCGMFSYDEALYDHCLNGDNIVLDPDQSDDGEFLGGDPTGVGINDEETLTLDEVLGSDDSGESADTELLLTEDWDGTPEPGTYLYTVTLSVFEGEQQPAEYNSEYPVTVRVSNDGETITIDHQGVFSVVYDRVGPGQYLAVETGSVNDLYNRLTVEHPHHMGERVDVVGQTQNTYDEVIYTFLDS